MKKVLLLTVFGAALSSPGLCQQSVTPPKPGAWEPSVEFDIAPTYGRSIPFHVRTGGTENSEYAAIFTLKRTRAIGSLPIKFNAGAAYDPNVFNTEDESNYYGEVVLGDDPYTLQAFRFNGADADKIKDQITPTAAFRYARVYSNFFDSYARTESTATIGITLKDERYIVCTRGWRLANRLGICGNTPKVSYKLAFQVSYLTSSERTERRLAPRVKFTLAGPVVAGSMLPFVRIDYEIRYYDAYITTIQRDRVDRRLMATAGFDIAPLLSKHFPMIDTAEVALMYFGRRSNDTSNNFDRAYFAPSIVLIKKFGTWR